MRSTLHPARPASKSFMDGFVQAVSEIGTALQLLGDLIASWTHTARKTDHSEPPDWTAAMQAV
jgi:hypothetical protein